MVNLVVEVCTAFNDCVIDISIYTNAKPELRGRAKLMFSFGKFENFNELPIDY